SITNVQGIVTKWNSSQTTYPIFGLNLESTGLKFVIYHENGWTTGNISETSSTGLAVNTWTHVVGTWSASGNQMSLYVNGVNVINTPTTSGTAPTKVGNSP